MKGALVSAVLLLAACSSRRVEPLSGPLKLTSDDERRGQVVFMQHCQQCHPNGEGGLGPSLNDKPAPWPVVRLQIRKGLGAMPGFDAQKLGDPDVDALVAYLKVVRHH